MSDTRSANSGWKIPWCFSSCRQKEPRALPSKLMAAKIVAQCRGCMAGLPRSSTTGMMRLKAVVCSRRRCVMELPIFLSNEYLCSQWRRRRRRWWWSWSWWWCVAGMMDTQAHPNHGRIASTGSAIAVNAAIAAVSLMIAAAVCCCCLLLLFAAAVCCCCCGVAAAAAAAAAAAVCVCVVCMWHVRVLGDERHRLLDVLGLDVLAEVARHGGLAQK